ncbi:hypothetical protein GH714_001272 [Hevea brasiliensis]|uniref:non-specific serine/threonine protein kinase n=1 Tax=Hevea brasiliensis TaxID=3981 RepID=A0A6A6LU91_HEVBR|nr:hypothetical protein GH714_001272 [Hevea brasiliensis]
MKKQRVKAFQSNVAMGQPYDEKSDRLRRIPLHISSSHNKEAPTPYWQPSPSQLTKLFSLQARFLSLDSSLRKFQELVPGDLVQGHSSRTYVWVANRDTPLTNSSGILKISNQTIVLLDEGNNLIWSSNQTKASNPVMQLLDTGNLVLREANESNQYLWQSFDYPTDTLLPDMKLGWDLNKGLDRYISSWRSTDDPATGDFSFKLEYRGFPEIFLWNDEQKEYRSGPWNGQRFSGVPEMKPTDNLSFDFVTNKDEDQCDNFMECGPYGICDSNASPVCECMRGFQPKNPQAWNLRDGSDGCVRKTDLQCMSDKFLRLKNMKLPESSTSSVDIKMSLKDCELLCLRNCSCTAYANSNISNGGTGCVIWVNELSDMRQYAEGGQDLYVRLAASDIAIQERSQDLLLNEVVISSKRDYSAEKDKDELELPSFDFVTISTATHNFSDENMLGQGGFGRVYKDSRFRIIHRDLKASNILLDGEWNPKISDFGMARIFGGDQTEASTRRVVGTYGYMSPEYAMDGVFSMKSDVFSFGVLVLEIVSGNKNRGFYHSNSELNLLGHAWRLWKEGKGLDLLDTSVGNSFSSSEVLRCLQVGLLCVQERAVDRPTMASVVLKLSSETATMPQPKTPGYCLGRNPFETDSSSGKNDESFTVNQVTVTMLDARSSMKVYYSILFWFSIVSFTKSSTAGDSLTLNQILKDNGQTLVSKDESFELGVFSPWTPTTAMWEYGSRMFPNKQLFGLQIETSHFQTPPASSPSMPQEPYLYLATINLASPSGIRFTGGLI